VGASHLRNIIIGAVILVAAFLLRDKLVAAAPDLFYYAVLVAGGALVVYGLMGHFKGSNSAAPDESKRSLAHEVLLKALSRMAYADTNIAPSEVETIQRIYEETTGEAISAGDVRVGARADIYEDHAFESYLKKSRGSLSDDDKKMIMLALAAVIRADGNVSPFEVGFFNEVCEALKVPPAALSDLQIDEPEPETLKVPDIPEEMLGERPAPPPADPEPEAEEDEAEAEEDEPATLKIEDEPETLKIEDEPEEAEAEEAEAEAEEAEADEEEGEPKT
jgi:uncharacterized tellurite resistance protein B-like protein